MKVEYIPLSSIVPDKDQPRKFFDEIKLRELSKSIKKHGVKNPLIVEDFGDGKFLLVDGERRYHASKMAELTEVPVIVDKPHKELDRKITQFHLQEQHENWSPTEKAVAIGQIAKDTGMNIQELSELLNLDRGMISRYVAFDSLIEKDRFTKLQLPLEMSVAINQVKNNARKIYEGVFKEPFIRSDERKLEKAILTSIQNSEITRRSEITRLTDVFTTNPKSIKDYIEKGFDARKAFLETDNQTSHTLRISTSNGAFLVSGLRKLTETQNLKLSEYQKATFKNLKKAVSELVDRFDE